jgi:hypothetical protein
MEVEMEDGDRPTMAESVAGAWNWNSAMNGDWGMTFLETRE